MDSNASQVQSITVERVVTRGATGLTEHYIDTCGADGQLKRTVQRLADGTDVVLFDSGLWWKIKSLFTRR